ncbi:MAG: hypothetical protein MHPSP_003405 [Paramarteilia canceri]
MTKAVSAQAAAKKVTLKQQKAVQQKNSKSSGNKKAKSAKKKWGASDHNKVKSTAEHFIANQSNLDKLLKTLGTGKQLTFAQLCDQLNITKSCAYKLVDVLIKENKIKYQSTFSKSILCGIAAAK